MKKALVFIVLFLILLIGGFYVSKKVNLNPAHSVGDAIDSLNHVKVYYNGGVDHVGERHLVDGYNIGMKYQCVEFVKRYYFEFYQHRMPDTYGNAKDFFIAGIADGKINSQRNLHQYTNPSQSKPKVGDLVVMDATTFNPYGHVAIISHVDDDQLEIIQQNPGPYSSSRETFELTHENQQWRIEHERILGWLRK